LNYVCIRWSDP